MGQLIQLENFARLKPYAGMFAEGLAITVLLALFTVLIGFILASVVNLLFSFFFYTPKMYRIGERNNELMLKYNILNDKIRAATAKLQELRHRDNNVYRSLFAADSLNLHGIYTPYPDTKYSFLEGDMYTTEMIGTWRDIDAMTRML